MVIKDNANIKTGEMDDTVKVTEDNLVFSVATDAHQCYLLIFEKGICDISFENVI